MPRGSSWNLPDYLVWPESCQILCGVDGMSFRDGETGPDESLAGFGNGIGTDVQSGGGKEASITIMLETISQTPPPAEASTMGISLGQRNQVFKERSKAVGN
jgi:hypothetical protein